MSVNSTSTSAPDFEIAQGLLAGRHRVHGKAALVQDLGNQIADENLVFDYKHTGTPRRHVAFPKSSGPHSDRFFRWPTRGSYLCSIFRQFGRVMVSGRLKSALPSRSADA